MGGTYYVLNLINALGTLPEEEKPEITLLCKSEADFDYARRYCDYPLLTKHIMATFGSVLFCKKVVNKLGRILFGRNLVVYDRFDGKTDAVYPVVNRVQIGSSSPLIQWIPDFQYLHLPDLFSASELKNRQNVVKELISTGNPIIFSSNDALNDFRNAYPEADAVKTFVWHFASKIPVCDVSERDEVLAKYNAPERFFFCANQFWAHKNHLTLFKAVKILKDSAKDVVVYCSGATNDSRNSEYFPSLQQYVEDNGLHDNIRLLGLMPRNEQLIMMRESVAVIQPSLFEGWSTSVEEAKAMNKFMILSDIALHREQVKRNGMFFSSKNPEALATAIASVYDNPSDVEPLDYRCVIAEAARNFMDVIDDICGK